jgi:hypothetical protein
MQTAVRGGILRVREDAGKVLWPQCERLGRTPGATAPERSTLWRGLGQHARAAPNSSGYDDGRSACAHLIGFKCRSAHPGPAGFQPGGTAPCDRKVALLSPPRRPRKRRLSALSVQKFPLRLCPPRASFTVMLRDARSVAAPASAAGKPTGAASGKAADAPHPPSSTWTRRQFAPRSPELWLVWS